MNGNKKKIKGWILAAGLAAGTLMGVTFVSAKDTVRPSDYVIEPQETYSYGDMGLSFTLPQELLEKMEEREVVMLPGAAFTEDGNYLQYGFLTWYEMDEEQKQAEIGQNDTEAYARWVEGLERIGSLGVFQREEEENLDELTGCTDHEKIGTSEDGEYVYYLSTKQDADQDLTEQLGEIETEITKMHSYQSSEMKEGESLGSFTTEDINGETYTEEVFSQAELTMVNVFATWCSPCINEIPYLAELDKTMEEKGVQVVGFVMDSVNGTEKNQEGIEKARVISEKTKAEYPFLLPDEGYLNGRIANIQAVPETFFVDKNGMITGETYSGSRSLEEWEEIVEQELKNLKENTEVQEEEKK